MTTSVTSALKCPIDDTVLEAVSSKRRELLWFCPRCASQWTEKELIEFENGPTTPLHNRILRSARGPLKSPTDSSFRTGATFPPFRTGPVAAPPTNAIDQLIANIGPVVVERVPAADEWTLTEIPTPEEQPTHGPIELFYDEIAEDFDQIMNLYDLRRRVDTVFDVLLRDCDLTGRTLLDAGCGTGWFSLAACRRGARVTALDIGPRLLDQVRRKCNADTVCGDVLDLDFADSQFHVVVSSECIEHTRNPRQAVHELVRVCRPGGLIVITTPNHFWYWLCAIANKLHLRPYEGLENWPRWSELRQWVEEAGGRTLETRGIHLFPFQLAIFHPVLKFLDRFGRFHGRFCVNQAILATKLC